MKLKILYGTETGNCRGLANKVAAKAEKLGVQATVIDLAGCDVSILNDNEAPVLLIISTWDDGLPPPKAAAFCNALQDAKMDLSALHYTVLALGDTEYPLYCECGRQVDAKLSGLGAKPILPRTDLGADYMVSYMGWAKNFWKTMAGFYGIAA